MNTPAQATVHADLPLDCRQVYRKIARRLIPFLFILYLIAYVDRVNVGFAKLQMSAELGFSDLVYGFGSGIFFIGYFLFEVPSNLILHRVGAKVWIARILLTWGVISAAMALVNSAASFYTLRFLLGVGEAGFFPGIILYLTYWFPSGLRAKSTTSFMTAIAVAGIVAGPVSGYVMDAMDGWLDLRGWQWLFLLEGLPAIGLGVVTYLFLDDGPESADWLSREEKQSLLTQLADDKASRGIGDPHESLRKTFISPRVWLLALIYFCLALGLYGVSFWLPQIIHDLNQGGLTLTGLLSAIPYAVAVFVMVAVARSSDATQERRWHIATSSIMGGLGLVMLVWVRGHPMLSIAALGLATSGILAALSTFWSLPTAFLSGRTAAGGIALINSIGNLGGYFGPFLLGWIKQTSGNLDAGLYVLASGLILAGMLVARIGLLSDTQQ